MKIKMKQLAFGIVCLMSVMALTSCDKTYQVQFVSDGSVVHVASVEKDQKVQEHQISKTGYTMLGWFLNDEKFDFENTPITGDITLQAKYEANEYTYTFVDEDETVLKSEKIKYHETIVAPADPSKAEDELYVYTFSGWDKEFSTITEDIVITAVYSKVDRLYTYTFVDEDETVLKSEKIKYHETIVAPADPTKAEDELYVYTFSGWDKEFSTITEDIVITAVYSKEEKKINYQVEFFDASGGSLKKTEVPRNSIIESVEVTKPDDDTNRYVFEGWYTDSNFTNKYDFSQGVTSNLTLYPKFNGYRKTLVGSKVSFLGDSITTFYEANSPMNSYYSGENQFYYPRYSATIKTVDKTWWATLLKNTETVLGINNSYSGSTCYNSGNSTNSAAMNLNRINTLNENGAPDIVIIHIGTNDIVSAYSNANFENAYRTMVARVKEVCPNAVIFVCTLGYSAYAPYSNTVRLAYNEIIRKIAGDTSANVIEFANVQHGDNYGMVLGDNLHPSATGAQMMAEYASTVIKAYFNKNDQYHSINYELNGGTVRDLLYNLLSSEEYTLPIPTLEGYDFKGWNTEPDFSGNVVTKITNLESNLNLYAEFVETPVVLGVTYNLNGGSWSSDVRSYLTSYKEISISLYNTGFWVSYQTDIFLFQASIAEGYVYADKIVIQKDPLTGLYRVSSIFGNGTGATYTSADDYVIVISSSNGYYSSLDLANTIKVGDYIGFNQNIESLSTGEINVNAYCYQPTDLTANLTGYPSDTSLPTPVREGYVFLGWYNNPSFSGEAVTTAQPGDELYASWQE